MNRVKISIILIILICFLCFVATIPVTCIFQTVTGISCPACGMTRAFISILHLNFFNAFLLNILSIPLFIFICISVIIIIIEVLRNQFNYIPKLLNFLGKYWYIFIILLIISFIWNNMRLI